MTTPADFTLANQLVILTAARRPSWREQATTTGPPTLSSDGVATGEALVAMLKVDCREDVAFRTVYAEIDTLDLAANYTLTIGGFAVTVNGAFTDLDDLLDTMVDAIQADTDANALVVASHTTDDTIKLTGRTSDDFAVDASATGTGEWALTGDAAGALARVYGLGYDTTGTLEDRWATLADSDLDVPGSGLILPRSVSGIAQVYVEIVEADAVVDDSADLALTTRVFVGPCPRE